MPIEPAVRRRRRDRRAWRFTSGLRRRALVVPRCVAVGRAHSCGLAALTGLSRRFLQSLLLVINTYRLSRAAGPFLRPFYDIPRLRLTTRLPFWDGFRAETLQMPTKPEFYLYLPVRAETRIIKLVFHGGRPSLHWAFGPYGALNSVYVASRNRSLSNF